MRLENLRTSDDRSAQEDLEELAQDLRRAGYEVEIASFGSPVRVIIKKSAENAALDVLNVVLNEVESHAVDAVVGGVASSLVGWARRRRHFGARSKQKATAVIWGPNGEVLRRVQLPDSEEVVAEVKRDRRRFARPRWLSRS
jgi:hypothetical protein